MNEMERKKIMKEQEETNVKEFEKLQQENKEMRNSLDYCNN